MSQRVVYTFSSGRIASLMTGLGISYIVFFILTAQVWIFFRRHTLRCRESRRTKVLVASIWLLQAAETALTSRISFIHVMEFQDIAHFIGHMSTEWALYRGICSLTTSLVHIVFIYRVCCIEKKLCGKRKMSLVLVALCVIEQAFGLFSAISVFKISSDNSYSMVLWSIPTYLGCSVIGDIAIAGTLAYILHSNRTESRRTNQIVTKIIIFCSQTGLVTTVAASITLGIWAVCNFDIDHLYMCIPMGGLYATCLLANFIARESYLQPQTIHEADVSKIAFARFTQEVDLELPSLSGTSPQSEQALVMEGGTGPAPNK
ncbi:hypothetical protein K503DRAFT_863816 [Rhizopogon vinicolor AM-OR11-026]|uniref:DUF6534 domain-containing protein n=1 Tax=Rhizopogon vinicolor AM-OR11-026 TaxID=1314800 RepID=A0A1B7N9F0_9AGAM|nr:hypothetical protein K503DRAFT_863816 [Rhizopogon vinicolor AM-OR11-026]